MHMNNTQMPQAAKNQQPQDTEQTYAVTVDGQTLELTLEQLIAAAEQGLSRANDAAKRSRTADRADSPTSISRFSARIRTSMRRISRRKCGMMPIAPVICWAHIGRLKFASCAKNWSSCAKMRTTAAWMLARRVRTEKTQSQIPSFLH